MNFKKIFILLLAFFILHPPLNVQAEEEFILDTQASTIIAKENSNSKFIISELNSGYVISQQNSDQKVNYKKLLNKLALFSISERLKENKLTLESYIHISNDDELKKLKIENVIQVKDLIFLLEQGSSNSLALSVFTHFNLREPDLQTILDKLSMTDTELNKFEISDENKISARNLTYINQQIILNYPGILEILKSPVYEVKSEEKINNNLFVENDTFSELQGFSYGDTKVEIIVQYPDIKLLLTFFDIKNDKEKFLNNLKELTTYLSTNYHYTPILKEGSLNINNENIKTEDTLYSLMKKTSSETPTYYLMNNRLLGEKNYSSLSANNSILQVPFSSLDKKEVTYSHLLREKLFGNKPSTTSSNKDKLHSYIEKVKLGLTLFLLFYVCISILIHFLKKQVKGRK